MTWGTSWEQGKQKKQKNPSLISVAPAFSLNAWNFYFQNCLSSFLAFLFFGWWVHQGGPSSTNKSLRMHPNNQHNRYPLYLSHFSFGWPNFCQKEKFLKNSKIKEFSRFSIVRSEGRAKVKFARFQYFLFSV